MLTGLRDVDSPSPVQYVLPGCVFLFFFFSCPVHSSPLLRTTYSLASVSLDFQCMNQSEKVLSRQQLEFKSLKNITDNKIVVLNTSSIPPFHLVRISVSE